MLRFESTARAGIPVRMITWNIDSSNKYDILKTLEAQQPDICFLQETPDGAASIQDADLIGYWKGFVWVDSGDTGILSRFPLRDLPTERVGPWEVPQVMVAELPGSGSLVMANVRLMLPSLVLNPLTSNNRERLKADHKARLAQFENLSDLMIRNRAAAPGSAEIIAGDFNSPARMHSLKPLRRFWRDAWDKCGNGWGATMTKDFPVSRIDQIWVNDQIEAREGHVVAPSLSDHRMVVMDLILLNSD